MRFAKNYAFSSFRHVLFMAFGERSLVSWMSAIFGLLCASRPFAIGWTVSLIVVDSFNRIVGRRLGPHVGDEVWKLKPTFAHRYASSSVTGVPFVVWISAALYQTGPTIVFGRYLAPIAMAVPRLNYDIVTAHGLEIYQKT
jgi:hypothetical protein